MKHRTILLLILQGMLIHNLCTAQVCNFAIDIVDVNCGVSVKYGKEYIRLLVHDPNNGFTTRSVDIEGYIIDDNNNPKENVGNEPGHLRFGPEFKEVQLGSTLWVYDTVVPSGYDPTDPTHFLVPASSLIAYEDCPNHDYSGYQCGPGGTANLRDFIPMNDEQGDLIQIRTWYRALHTYYSCGQDHIEDITIEQIYMGPYDDGCDLTRDVQGAGEDCVTVHIPPSVDDGCDLTTDYFDWDNCLIVNEGPDIDDDCDGTIEFFDPFRCEIVIEYLPCDDGDPTTIGDSYNDECECKGCDPCLLEGERWELLCELLNG